MISSNNARRGDPLTAYLRLVKAEPELFENTDAEGYQILLDEDEIRGVQDEAFARLASRGDPPDWGRIGLVHEDAYIRILRDAVRFPDGTRGTYFRILIQERVAEGAAVLPLLRGEVVLLRHFRHATRSWHLEIPRGFGEKGVSPGETARRELAEEICAVAERIEPLGDLHIDTGLMAHRVHLFLAHVHDARLADSREAIDAIVTLPVDRFEQGIAAGEIADSFTLAAYARAKARGLMS